MPVWKILEASAPSKQSPMKCYLIFFHCLHNYHSKLPAQNVLLLRIQSVGDGELFSGKGSEKNMIQLSETGGNIGPIGPYSYIEDCCLFPVCFTVFKGCDWVESGL